MPKVDLGVSLSQFYECPFVEYDDKIIPPPDLMKELQIEYLSRNLWLPLRREDNASSCSSTIRKICSASTASTRP